MLQEIEKSNFDIIKETRINSQSFLAENEEQEVHKVSWNPLEQHHANHVQPSILRDMNIGIPEAEGKWNLVLHVVRYLEEFPVSDALRFMLRNIEDRNFSRSEIESSFFKNEFHCATTRGRL